MADEETAQAEQESTTESKTFTEDQVRELLAKETEGLKSKVDELLGEAKKAKAKAREEEAARTKAAEEAARKSGDVEALEKSWMEKHAATIEEYESKLKNVETALQKRTLDAQCAQWAAEVAMPEDVEYIAEQIRKRIGYSVEDGNVNTFIVDKDGNRIAATKEDLFNELRANPTFKKLMRSNVGTGAGGVGQNGGAASQKTVTRAQWDAMSHVDRAAFSKAGGKVTNAA